MSQIRLVTVLGARPQFIKAAPVSRAIDALATVLGAPAMVETVVHTGQHYDARMSDVFFLELGLRPPAYQLGIGSGSHGEQTGRMLEKLDAVLRREGPDMVLVYGDTNSTLAGALAAAKLSIPVAHVEAGARSYRRSMPEEINRVVTDHLSDWLFCATPGAVAALRNEGITRGVHVVGDVMFDAVVQHRARAERSAGLLRLHNLAPRTYALVTIHRAENTDDGTRLARIVDGIAAAALDQPVVWPVHPRTRAALADIGRTSIAGVQLVPPASYLEMIQLCANARVILTDSGGVQREAMFLHTPCVTLRDETEWPETIEAGWNRLVAIEPDAIAAAARKPEPGKDGYGVFGDGRAAERIAAILSGRTAEPLAAPGPPLHPPPAR